MSPLDKAQIPISGASAGQAKIEKDARIYDYCKACNPEMAAVPHLALPPELHENGE